MQCTIINQKFRISTLRKNRVAVHTYVPYVTIWKKNDLGLLDVEVTFDVDLKNKFITYYFHKNSVLPHVRYTPNKIQNV